MATDGAHSPSQASLISSRLPLLPRALSNLSSATKHVRRKASSIVLRSDSSDIPLSSHGSIYDAQCFSGSEDPAPENIALPASESSVSTRGNDENVKGGGTQVASMTLPDIQFLYGNGTLLDTISEKKSCLTMRSLAKTKSADNLSNAVSLSHSDSFISPKVPRRKQSLSLDDLALLKIAYHKACSTIDGKAFTPSPSIHEIYAQPKIPIHDPVTRSPTPPGMPSWDAGQDRGRPSQPPPVEQRQQSRWYGLRETLRLSHRLPTQPTLTAQGPPSVAVYRPAPRFRAPRSAYGPIEQHPFNRAPVALISPHSAPRSGRRRLQQRVRFTPSATARDSEMNVLRTAIESTSATAVNPMTPMVATPLYESRFPGSICPHRSLTRAARDSLRRWRMDNLIRQQQRSVGLEAQITTPCATPDGSPTRSDTHPSTPTSLEIDGPIVAQGSAGGLLSNESSEHLMSGAVIRTKSKCWKCHVDKGMAKLDKWWSDCASCLCFVCCGYDIEDMDWAIDLGEQRRTERSFPQRDRYAFAYLDGPADPYLMAPRRLVLSRVSTFDC